MIHIGRKVLIIIIFYYLTETFTVVLTAMLINILIITFLYIILYTIINNLTLTIIKQVTQGRQVKKCSYYKVRFSVRCLFAIFVRSFVSALSGVQ